MASPPNPNKSTVASLPRTNVAIVGEAFDRVNRPAHYASGKLECIDAIEAALAGETDAFAGHLRATAIKYLWRAGKKEDAIEDAKKAVWYITKYIERKGQP